jgi:hypothetical protein
MERFARMWKARDDSKSKPPKFVRWAVMLGIVIILNVFFVVLRGLIFTSPQYTDYCPASTPVAETSASCMKAGGDWIPSEAPTPVDSKATAPVTPGGYCDYTQKCQKPYDAAQKAYETKSFVLMVALGLVAIIIGVLPLGSSIVSTGLSYGGVLAFVIASAQYWNDATQFIQLGISALALAALIYIGLKSFRD